MLQHTPGQTKFQCGADNEFFMAERAIVLMETGYNLNLLHEELMTACPGKLCHCYVHDDCQDSAHKLISFFHFPSSSVRISNNQTQETSNYQTDDCFVFLKWSISNRKHLSCQ